MRTSPHNITVEKSCSCNPPILYFINIQLVVSSALSTACFHLMHIHAFMEKVKGVKLWTELSENRIQQ